MYTLAAVKLSRSQNGAPASHGRPLRDARAALAIVWTFYLIRQPAMCTALRWWDIIRLTPHAVEFELVRGAVGRKNNTASTRRFIRRLMDIDPAPDQHSISMLYACHQAVKKLAVLKGLRLPTYV